MLTLAVGKDSTQLWTLFLQLSGSWQSRVYDFYDDVFHGLPRSIDQLLTLEWKYLLPINLMNIVLMAF